jgi:TPR repeat protein
MALLITQLLLGQENSSTSLDGAIQAYEKADYPAACEKALPLADNGDPDAQFLLGRLYYFGRGVAQDFEQAAKWYRLAAEQGLAPAQVQLGLIYALGESAPQDFVQAYLWLSLAGAQGNSLASELGDEVAKQMTSSQIEKAQALARDWQPKTQR